MLIPGCCSMYTPPKAAVLVSVLLFVPVEGRTLLRLLCLVPYLEKLCQHASAFRRLFFFSRFSFDLLFPFCKLPLITLYYTLSLIVGSHPCSKMESRPLFWISSCLVSSTFSSGTPTTNARSAVRFQSCRTSLSARISSAGGLFLQIFFVGRYTLFRSNTASFSSSLTWRLICCVSSLELSYGEYENT